MEEINYIQIEALFKTLTPVFTGEARFRFKNLRMAILLDQGQLAKALRVGVATITNIENGARCPRNPITMERLISVFGLRGTVHVLTGMYVAEHEDPNVWGRYWNFKNSFMGNRKPYAERPETRYRDISKLGLIDEVDNLRKLVKSLQFKKAAKAEKD